MSFSCPHFDIANDRCLLLATDCVAGRPGCVLRNTSVFYVPAEERLKEKEKELEEAARKPRLGSGRRRSSR